MNRARQPNWNNSFNSRTVKRARMPFVKFEIISHVKNGMRMPSFNWLRRVPMFAPANIGTLSFVVKKRRMSIEFHIFVIERSVYI